ncbi:transcriptional regulator, TetR family [Collimonas sp. OK307]|uniref:TetR/AcrR family transcriptional regulator n=1 Tax=Collimonas sp. OK307 TaxID=1801620 RepID=UPI0008EC9675|nr:TetR/AcrR family transcriptional regulator [Collimonas sp. OK307]SFH79100.1 transcriptional regulator, TetR family [Collimonas sp. OK307]
MMLRENQKANRRDLQKEETRRLILESAYALFQQHGYDLTTMRQLASHCGVGLGTLFKHFPDKPAILVAAFEEDIGAILARAFKTLPKRDIHLQLKHVLSDIYGYYAKNQSLSRVLVKESLFLTGPAGQIVHAQTMAFLEKIGLLFIGAAQRKEIAPIGDVTEVAIGFWSFYLLGLTVGLRDSEFKVDTQAAMVSTLLQSHYPLLTK